jgi:hypothetical protein
MGIINIWIHRSLVKKINAIRIRRVKKCVHNSMRLSDRIPTSLGLLEDALPLFYAYIYAIISCFVVLLIELLLEIKKFEFKCKINYVLRNFSNTKERQVHERKARLFKSLERKNFI